MEALRVIRYAWACLGLGFVAGAGVTLILVFAA
jgi:hypothetical protein